MTEPDETDATAPDVGDVRAGARTGMHAHTPAAPDIPLDAIFQIIPAGIVYFDHDLRILRINPAGLRAIGAHGDAVGRTFAEVATAAGPALAPAFERVIETGRPLTFWSYPVPRAQVADDAKRERGDAPTHDTQPAANAAAGDDAAGTTYWDYTLWPFAPRAADGTTARRGVLLLAVEVTGRVSAERDARDAITAAQHSAGKLQGLVEQMADGVLVSDAAGRVLTINQAAFELLGPAAAALAGDYTEAHGAHALLRHADGRPLRPDDYPWRQAASEGRVSRDIELVVPGRQGRDATLSVNAAPLHDEAGRLTGAVAVLRDVSERRQMIEELREANHRLEEFNRLKAEFVANMSHELRTPLTAIIGFAQLMQMDAVGPALAKPQAEALERILRNGRHLLSLIDDVLDLSKIEVGRIAVHPDHVDLVETVQAAFSELQSLARQKGLDYRLHVREEFPLAYTDPLRIRQIVINLLSNAIKFTVQGSVEAEMARAGDDEWRFTVRDTGVGMRPDALDIIFERFRQVDGSTTRPVGGVGLGLTIVQQIVRLLGGRVEVESTYGQGSTFTVTLPLAISPLQLPATSAAPAKQAAPAVDEAGAHVTHAATAPQAATTGRPLVLVIEDDADAAQLLRETLARAGFHVELAEAGDEGLNRARALAPDAITLDIMMPRVDGWRVLQALKEDGRTAQIPVVVCSIVDNRPLGYRLGASDYLVKPVAPERLIESLRGIGATAEGGNGYVLVVDDEQGVRTLMATALRKAGYSARAAASGEIAFGMALRQTPRAVLCDLLMPGGMSGFELIARLRADARTAHVPVIVITGKDMTQTDRRLLGGQIADVIRKGDLLLPDLESRLREVLEEIGVEPTDGQNPAR